MTMKRIALGGLHLALALAMAAPGFAQDLGVGEPPAFPKGNYRVQTTDGSTLRGQLQRMTPETLRILVDGTSRELPMSTVEKVDRPTHRALVGLAVGAAAGMVIGGLQRCETTFDFDSMTVSDRKGPCIAAGGIMFGLIGLGTGWVFSRAGVIYRRARK